MEIQKIPSKLFTVSSIDLKDEIEEVRVLGRYNISVYFIRKIESHDGFFLRRRWLLLLRTFGYDIERDVCELA